MSEIMINSQDSHKPLLTVRADIGEKKTKGQTYDKVDLKTFVVCPD